MISLVLAAGKGTRMKSEIPKVLHTVNGLPMLVKVKNVLENVGIKENIFILGHKKEKVLEIMGDIPYVEQLEQLGTGHAVLVAKKELEKYKQDVLITCGDTPLIKEETLEKMISIFKEKELDVVLLSCEVKNPFGNGRIINKNGNIVDIVEEKEANEEIRAIKEINAGVYIFKYEKLLEAVSKIDNNNQKGEYYLTDAIKYLVNDGYKVESYKIYDEDEILGVNSKVQLSQANAILRRRKNEELMDDGVIMINPDSTYIEENVVIGQDTIIYPNVMLQGETKIGRDSLIFGNTRIENSIIGDNVKIESSLIESAIIEKNATIGPFAHLRPKAHLKEDVHVGNFVEVKNSVLEKGVKAGHLTYLGDSNVGDNTNIGAGTITCNYDGKNKHKTIIGENVFIGSNTILVAPVELGDNTFTAAGSVITEQVPEGNIAFGRSRQINKERGNK